MRFLIACLLGAGGCVAGMLVLGSLISGPTPATGRESAAGRGEARPHGEAGRANDDRALEFREVKAGAEGPPALVVAGGRVLPVEWQDVPSQRDGQLLFLATEPRPGEVIPPDRQAPHTFSILAVRVPSWEGVPDADRIADPNRTGWFFRRAHTGDELPAGRTVIIRKTVVLRRIDVGERVQKGQLLGVINPALAEDELALKLSKVEAASADAAGAAAMAEESRLKVERMKPLVKNRAVPADEYGAARAAQIHYEQDELSKRAAIQQAQRELSAARTTLQMHLIRASMAGVVKTRYRQDGEAVKNNESVLRIQSPARLLVEASVEEHDALLLRERLEEARSLAARAEQLRLRGGAGAAETARGLVADAHRLLQVQIEASRVVRPAAALAGHLQAVTCIALTRGPSPRIVTGSDDQTVRIWSRESGLWREVGQFNHHAAIRAVACSPAGPNRLLTTTATGQARLFDLDHLGDAPQRVLETRPAGGITAAAFSPDGARCATGGDDQAVCLFDVASGRLLARRASTHGGAVTSLAFTAQNQLVSAGRDRRLAVWNLGAEAAELKLAGDFDNRSGDVPSLGVDPVGGRGLFDDGRDLRVLALRDRKIVGLLRNPSATGAFTTTAQFSPDGRMVLTYGGPTVGLQLWRAPGENRRPAELRQLASPGGPVVCAAFSPDGRWVAAGTQDQRVLVWPGPEKAEAEPPIAGELNYVEEFLDTSLKRVAVRATFDNPGWVISGTSAVIVAPPALGRR